MNEAMGYVEVEGLSTAIVLADKMLKTANVALQTIENSKGSGWVTLAINGDVSAVTVAIEEARNIEPDKVVSCTVIARPAKGIAQLGHSDAIKGFKPTIKAPAKEVAAVKPAEKVTPEEVKENSEKPASVAKKTPSKGTKNAKSKKSKK